jgi:hypothetical protein
MPPEAAGAPGPDIVFLKLQDALDGSGCPICRIGAQITERFLWGYLYERVNDAASRRELIAARGFCHRHAWALRRFHDTLGIAILYRHLLEELAGDIRRSAAGTARTPRAAADRLRAALAPAGGCPACLHVRDLERSALQALVTRLELPEVRARLSGPASLCMPHFLAAAAMADRAGQTRLVEAQLVVITMVHDDLDELVRKHDYRFREEGITVNEAASWTRAIELLVGRDRC